MLRIPVNGNIKAKEIAPIKKPPTNIVVLDKNRKFSIISKLNNSVQKIPLPQTVSRLPTVLSIANQLKPIEALPKTTSIVSGKTPIGPEYRDLFTALLKIKDSKLTSRVLAAINDCRQSTKASVDCLPETLCSKCRGPLRLDKQTDTNKPMLGPESVRTQSCQTNFTGKGLDLEVKTKRYRGPYAASVRTITPEHQIENDKTFPNIGWKQKVNLKKKYFIKCHLFV